MWLDQLVIFSIASLRIHNTRLSRRSNVFLLFSLLSNLITWPMALAKILQMLAAWWVAFHFAEIDFVLFALGVFLLNFSLLKDFLVFFLTSFNSMFHHLVASIGGLRCLQEARAFATIYFWPRIYLCSCALSYFCALLWFNNCIRQNQY